MLCSFIIVVYTEVNVPISIPWKYPACNEGKLADFREESKRIVVNLKGIHVHVGDCIESFSYTVYTPCRSLRPE